MPAIWSRLNSVRAVRTSSGQGTLLLVADATDRSVKKFHDASESEYVRGRNIDNSCLRKVLEWEPSRRLRDPDAPTSLHGAEDGAAREGDQRVTPLVVTPTGSGREFQ